MYRHTVDSIVETTEKRFISQADKDKYDSYANRFISRNNTVSKQEIDSISSNMTVNMQQVENKMVTLHGTKAGIVDIHEIKGHSKHHVTLHQLQPALEIGTLSNTHGGLQEHDQRVRTVEFIPVNQGDKVQFANDIPGQENLGNIIMYNKDKGFVRYSGFLKMVEIPYDCAYIKYYHRSDYKMSRLYIMRRHLSDIRSVGKKLNDGTYNLRLKSCGKNIYSKDHYINSVKNSGVGTGTYNFVEEAGRECLQFHARSFNRNVDICSTFKENTQYVLKFKAKFSHLEATGGSSLYLGFLYDDGTNDTARVENTVTEFTEFTVTSRVGKTVNSIVTSYGVVGAWFFIDLNSIHIEEYVAGKETVYMEPETNIYDINLPTQLESVGNYTDRLFRREDGVWCIEKNIKKLVLDGSENWYNIFESEPVREKTQLFQSNVLHNLSVATTNTGIQIMSDKFKPLPSGNLWTTDDEGIAINSLGYVQLRIARHRLSENGEPATSANEWIKDNNITIMYATTEPEIIELPRDVQVSLPSFEGTTNIFSEEDSGAVINCKLPLNVGAVIKTNNKSLIDIQDRLISIRNVEKSNRVEYSGSFNSGLTIKNSNVGVIDDIKIEGQTYINRAIFTYDTESTDSILRTIETIGDGTYTFINRSSEKAFLRIFDKATNVWKRNINLNIAESVTLTLTDEVCVGIGGLKSAGYELLRSNAISMLVLDGEYSNLGIDLFTGMISTGSTEKQGLAIVSRNESGNLFPINRRLFSFTSSVATWHDVKGGKYMYNNMWGKTDTAFYLEEGEYTVSYGEITNISSVQLVTIDDGTSYLIQNIPSVLYVRKSGYYVVRVKNVLSDSLTTISDIVIKKQGSDPKYSEVEIDKKELVYLDDAVNAYKPITELRSIDSFFYNNSGQKNGQLSRIADTIEKHGDNNWYYHKRISHILINENTSIVVSDNYSNDYYITFSTAPISDVLDTVNISCDKFEYRQGFKYHTECIWTGINETARCIRVKIKRSRLKEQTVAGIKEWLSTNPLNVLYESKNEKVYKCNPISLATYDGETDIRLNTVRSEGKISFTTTKYVGDTIRVLKERLNAVQEYIYNRTIFQNRLLLENRYNTDQTILKVDIMTFNDFDSQHTVDLELYDLIVSNISVGKYNYNREEMENLIDFYTMIGSLDITMADELFEMLDK